MDWILKAKSISKIYHPNIEVLKSIDLTIKRGEFVTIIGPTGCGKTTLLKIIAGLIKDYNGEVKFNNCQKLVMVFQDHGLFPWRTVRKNIEIGLEIQRYPKEFRKRKVKEYIKRFGLESFEDKYPHELSGGMKQKVAIARAITTEPDLILMDEPFASLDFYTRLKMQNFLLSIWQKNKKTILFVTHNIEEAILLSDRVIILSKRPAKILNILSINLPKPTNRENYNFFKLYKKILTYIS